MLERDVEEIVRSIGIPPCPAILTRLVQETRGDEPDYVKVGRLISGDVGLAAAVLQTVNSPFYGLRTKATSVSQALSLMGLRNVAQLVTGLLLKQAFPVASGKAMEQFWDVSSNVATISAWLAARLSAAERDDAYTFGLFRNCGIPVLLLKFSDYAGTLAAQQRDGTRRLIELEEENYWIDHCQVGHFLACRWHLPEPTCLAILHHHDYSLFTSLQTELTTSSLKLIALGLIAEHLFVRHCGEPSDIEWRIGGEAALRYLGISGTGLVALYDEMQELLSSA